MSKISYANLKIKTDNKTKSFDFNGNQIEVLQYLPIDDKYSLINVTLQKAREKNIYNPVKLDLYFHLNIIYMYTNLNFTEKQREDEAKLYDTLLSNGIIEKVIDLIPECEYDDLYNYLTDLKNEILTHQNTFAGVVSDIIENLPINAAEMQKIVDTFDPEKYKNVIDFARAANGGRDIK